MNPAADIGDGLRALSKGVGLFLKHRNWWRHAALPMALTLGLYVLFFWLIAEYLLPYCLGFLPEPGEFVNAVLRMLILALRWVTGATIYLGFVVVFLTTLSVLYEFFGNIFFDALVECCERDVYRLSPVKTPMKFKIRAMFQAAWYAAGTLLWHMILLVLSLLLPGIGWVLMLPVLGKRLGTSYFFSVGFYHGLDVHGVKKLLRGHNTALTALGTGAYLLLLIPFSAVLLLPALVISGTVLYHDRILLSR